MSRIEDAYPLSPMQEGMLFMALLDPESAAYFEQTSVRLRGPVKVEALERAWRTTMERHEILRTSFHWEGLKKPVQVVHRSVAFAFETRTVSEERELEALKEADRKRGFELSVAPLLRVTWVKLGEEEHELIWSFHHLLLDGWCLPIVMKEVLAGYEAYASGKKPVFASTPKYRDYIAWLAKQDQGAAERYFRKLLAGFEAPTSLGIASGRVGAQPKTLGVANRRLDEVETQRLKGAAKGQGLTVNTLMQGAWGLLLARYGGTKDVVFGAVGSGRPAELPGIESMVGLFINTLPVRVRMAPGATGKAILSELQAQQVETRRYEASPLSKVQTWSEVSPGQPLFESLYVFENYPLGEALKEPVRNEARLRVADVQTFEQTNYALTLTVAPGEALTLRLQYDVERFDSDAVERLLSHYVRLVEGLVAQPNEPALALAMLSVEEQRQQLVEWNDTAREYPKALIHELFVEQARNNPDAVAVSFEGETLTYRELDERANQLGHYLQKRGVGPDMLVGLCVERSLEMIVGLLGILKAGGAYVPLDPSYPEERLAYMLTDSATPLLLTQARVEDALPAHGAEVVALDRDWAKIDTEKKSAPHSGARPEHLAYVIYTSGSTGRPKGVTISHGALRNLVGWHRREFDVGKTARATQLASAAFDASVWEVWPYLATGASVHVVPEDVRHDAARLRYWLQRELITISFVPTPLLEQLLDSLEDESWKEGPALLLTGGDRLSRTPNSDHSFVLVNNYGPTENTVVTTSGPVGSAQRERAPAIGRPIDNITTYVLDDEMGLAPAGVAGELCVGGVQLARGYLNRPELTGERFVPDPSGAPGVRIYRTGDSARWSHEGELEYLGRIDHQVKIRGFRIELGEIEAALSEQSGIEAAAVLAREDVPGQKRLVAYVTGTVDVATLKTALATKLPDYMVPAAFVVLDAMPSTPNGKVDRMALPAPSFRRDEAEYVAPRNEVEEKLAAIWKEVLRVERVGIRDHFFELGGDSILSIQVVSRARTAGVHITPKQLFEYPRIAELAKVAGSGEVVIAEQGLVHGGTELTPIEHWFFEHGVQEEPHHFNQMMLLSVNGALDDEALNRALNAVETQHDALRLRYRLDDGTWKKTVRERSKALVSERLDLSGLAERDQRRALEADATRSQASLDLDAGPIARVRLYDLGVNGKRVLLVIHHVAVDGVSWRVLLGDLETAYLQAARGARIELGAKTTSVKAWASRLSEWAKSEEAERELAYWRGGAEATRLPTEGHGVNVVSATETRVVALSEEETEALLREVPPVYRTQVNDALLLALTEAFEDWTGSPRLRVDLEGHGREELFADVDLSRTVGWFTSLYPVELDVSSVQGTGDRLKAVKEQLRAIPNRGIGYGALKYLGRAEVRAELGAQRAPEVSFNYLGQLDQALATGSMFAGASEASGEAQSRKRMRDHLIDVNAQVSGKRLSVAFTYSPAVHGARTLEALGGRFVQSLQRLIEHCRKPEAGGCTPSDFPLATVEQAWLDREVGRGDSVEDVYALSPMQEGMLFMALLDPESAAYFEQTSVRLRGPVKVEALERAWRTTMERHEILRTSFHWEELEKPVQVVHRSVAFAFETRTVSEERELEALKEADRKRGFELSVAPLLRVTWVKLGEEEHELIWSFHHLLLDGWCLPIVMKEVLAGYEAYASGKKPVFASTPKYRDYIAWLAKQDQGAAERYFRKLLAGFEAPTSLGIASGRVGAQPKTLGVANRRLDEVETQRLKGAAKGQGLTVNTLMQGAWGLLLARYGGTKDVVFGAVGSGRPAELPGIESMVGLFINTLPVRVRMAPGATGKAILSELQAQQVETRRYEASPLSKVQTWSEVSPGQPLFESLYVFENYPLGEALKEPVRNEARLRVADVQTFEQTNYALTLTVAPGEALTLRLQYDVERFDSDAVERLLSHYVRLVEGLVAQPNEPALALAMLSVEEQHQQLVEWNDTARAYPKERLLHEQFAEQAKKSPDAIAVTFEGETLTYRELDERSNQLGHYLQKRGVGPDMLVGLCVERSLEMIVGLLGILKAGGAYVPLDPSYPEERLAYMLADSATPLLLTQARLEDALPAHGAEVVALDRDWAKIDTEKKSAPHSGARPEHLAYVIYTSGSTGRPKGTLLPHRGLVNMAAAYIEHFTLDGTSRVLQFASLAFDASVQEIAMSLLSGAALHLCGAELRAGKALAELLRSEAITVVTLPPVVLTSLSNTQLPALRSVISAGEACTQEIIDAWSRGRQLVNGYGPTEVTVCATWATCAVGEPPSIGRPLPNKTARVLDDRLQPVPVGVAGELILGGEGLARGYLRRPELTAERFMPDPFSAVVGARMYHSGDSARWSDEGELEYLGRIDQQVKIRGFRIELGEIETALRAHANVRDVVVVAREDVPGQKRLVAYVAGDMDIATLRGWLGAKVPEYMVPAAFVVVDALPSTPNGKLDRKALPAPSLGRDEAEYVAPRNEVEEKLAIIWQEVLRVERVGIRDNFFDLGGESILSIRVVSRAKAAGVHITPKQLFEHPTIERLAAREPGRPHAPLQIRRGSLEGRLPLSFNQQRTWRAIQRSPDSTAFNMARLIDLLDGFDVGLFERCVAEVMRRHSILRSTYHEEHGAPYLLIQPTTSVRCTVIDVSGVSREEVDRRIAQEQYRRFDLTRDPLIRLCIWKTAPGRSHLLIVVHHIAFDAWSLSLFREEAFALYSAWGGQKASPLRDLPLQYTDYSAAHMEAITPEIRERQGRYWRHLLADSEDVVLRDARARTPQKDEAGALSRAIPPEATVEINDFLKANGYTLFILVMTAYLVLLSRESGSDDQIVGFPISVRKDTELERLIGYFVNNLCVRLKLSDEMTWQDLLSLVREQSIDAQDHGDISLDAYVTEEQRVRVYRYRLNVLPREGQIESADPESPDTQERKRRGPKLTVVSPFEYAFYVIPTSNRIIVSSLYRTTSLTTEVASRINARLIDLLTKIVRAPTQRIKT